MAATAQQSVETGVSVLERTDLRCRMQGSERTIGRRSFRLASTSFDMRLIQESLRPTAPDHHSRVAKWNP
jgi:hypothetical protein